MCLRSWALVSLEIIPAASFQKDWSLHASFLWFASHKFLFRKHEGKPLPFVVMNEYLPRSHQFQKKLWKCFGHFWSLICRSKNVHTINNFNSEWQFFVILGLFAQSYALTINITLIMTADWLNSYSCQLNFYQQE